MSSVNKAIILGNVGKPPEVRTFQNGDKVANFSVATSEKWKDKQSGEQREATQWHNVVVFGALVSVVERFVQKGTKVYIEGRIETRKWQDQSGQDRWSTEVVLRPYGGSLVLCSSGQGQDRRDDQGGYGGSDQGGQGGYGAGADMDDEIPFAPEWRG